LFFHIWISLLLFCIYSPSFTQLLSTFPQLVYASVFVSVPSSLPSNRLWALCALTNPQYSNHLNLSSLSLSSWSFHFDHLSFIYIAFAILPPTVGSVHFSGPAFILPENIQVVNPVILAELQLGAFFFFFFGVILLTGRWNLRWSLHV
jgi:hypothetical protein